ncbi:peptidylprolyl isomerase [Desulfovibrio sp. ZJ200]|uniref:peptidylprolyl isomerase n=1 Tax=Desulfovibrio sp. ZJ200 TaxID=2709792 RepID=UPI0013ECECFC|nr:peptidylprolyl isomerase [Desulfovibrio sp. ZJ200]
MNAVLRAARLVALFFCCFLLAACPESRLPEGVVAVVNGEPIHLRSVQALLDSRSAALGTLQRPSLESMKRQYGEALGTLIIHALVRQELQRLQIPVGDAALEQAVAVVREDYGADGLARFLADESLDQKHWRALMRDHLAMIAFEKRVLLPGIRVALPEVRAYYQAHTGDFQLPETLEICFATAERREALDDFRNAFPQGRTAAREALLAQCLDVKIEELPQSWRREVASLKPGTCSAARREDETWQAIGLVQRHKARTLALVDAYPLIERILREQKKITAFESWLERNLARSTIQVTPYLKDDLLLPFSGRQQSEKRDGRAAAGPGSGDAEAPEPEAGQSGHAARDARQPSADAPGKAGGAGEL